MKWAEKDDLESLSRLLLGLCQIRSLVEELPLLAARGQSLKSKRATFHSPAIKVSLEAKAKLLFSCLVLGRKQHSQRNSFTLDLIKLMS